jgi:hypothetical protein
MCTFAATAAPTHFMFLHSKWFFFGDTFFAKISVARPQIKTSLCKFESSIKREAVQFYAPDAKNVCGFDNSEIFSKLLVAVEEEVKS